MNDTLLALLACSPFRPCSLACFIALLSAQSVTTRIGALESHATIPKENVTGSNPPSSPTWSMGATANSESMRSMIH
jgi:hypothetical protein